MPPKNIKRHLSHQNNMKWISKWFQVDQKLINSFAKVTLDNQFIHTDQNKAKETKFGSTIAHGFLTMSLLSAMYYDAVPENDALKMGINIGFDKLRFLAPVRCNDNIRGVFQLLKTAEKGSNIMTLTWDTRIEINGSSKPALLASWIERQYF